MLFGQANKNNLIFSRRSLNTNFYKGCLRSSSIPPINTCFGFLAGGRDTSKGPQRSSAALLLASQGSISHQEQMDALTILWLKATNQ